MQKSFGLMAMLLALAVVAASCGQSSETAADTETAAAPTDTDSSDIDFSDWDSVLAAADGTTVRWHMWGGNDSLNTFVDDVYGAELEKLGVNLERVPLGNTKDAVATVIAETEANTEEGSVDLIWINGANSANLADQGLLLTDWARSLPNTQFVNFDSEAVSLDFGRDIGTAQSPWASAQTQLVYDSANLDEADLPRSYEELATYACDNPGRVTYVDPNDFHGARFLNGALYELAGGTEQFIEFDEQVWSEQSPALWDWLNEWESCLWRDGQTYPEDDAALHGLLANGEVDFSITLESAGAAAKIADGTLPETARAFVFDDWMVGDSSYVAIPSNASNPAGAAVLANVLLEPALQAQQISPEAGGSGFAIDANLIEDESIKKALEQALAELPEGSVAPEDLAGSVAPVAGADYQTKLGEDWRPNVLEA